MSEDSYDQSALLRKVAVGMDAEAFLDSDLGKLLMERAQEEAIAAMDELKTVRRSDFTDEMQFVARLMELQDIVARAEGLESWITEIVVDGRNTEELLLKSEQEEEQIDD